MHLDYMARQKKNSSMRHCLMAFVLVTAAFFTPVSVAGQALPRTSTGQPDLQGIWTNATLTPLERPPELRDKEFFTPQEAVEYEKQARERTHGDRRDSDT